MDQVLYGANSETMTSHAVGWKRLHLKSRASYPKSDSVCRCEFTRGTILPNFIPIGFETTEP